MSYLSFRSAILNTSQLHPDVDFTPALNGYVDDNSLWMVDPSDPKLKVHPDNQFSLPTPRPILKTPDFTLEDTEPSDDEMDAPTALDRSFKAMSLDSGPPRFLGKSSRFVFFRKAFNYKYAQAGVQPPDLRKRATEVMGKKKSELLFSQPVRICLRRCTLHR